MSDIGLPLNPGTLPYPCYPASPQTFYTDMFRLGSATTADLTGVVISDSTPAPENQDKLWIKTVAGSPVGQFKFFGAQWVWPNPTPANSDERRLWVGLEANLVTYDGGEAGVVGAASGPMWISDPEFAGRMPVGAGLIPDSTTTVVQATNYGTSKHTLLITELPAHHHSLTYQAFNYEGGAAPGKWPGGTTALTETTGDTGGGTAFEFIPPARGVFFIKRTGRQFYRG